MTLNNEIYIGTILLEINRHTPPKEPSYLVSEWIPRFVKGGFEGMEVWENHAKRCTDEEREKLQDSPLPVSVFNSYCGFEDGDEQARREAARLSAYLGAKRIKFNLGKEPTKLEEYRKNLRTWCAMFPDDMKFLCECHPGTVIEEPEAALEFFTPMQDNRFEVIVHPFWPDVDVLRRWFTSFGKKVTHAHIQLRDEHQNVIRLERNRSLVTEALAIMIGEGYAGSFTLEFTEGMKTPDENIESLYHNALQDLQLLKKRLI